MNQSAESQPITCRIPTTAMSNNRIVEQCEWLEGAIELYCAWASKLDAFKYDVQTQAYWLSQCALVPIGILGNVFLYLTLRLSKMPGVTFLFLRMIALFLIGQSLFTIGSTSSGYLFRDLYLKGQMSLFWSNMLGQRIFPTFMRLCKLNVCVLSAALTFERYFALAHPKKYSELSEKFIYKVSVVVSLVVGCLEFFWLAEVSTSPTGEDVQLNTMGKQRIYLTYIIYIIVSIKLFVIFSLIGFSVVVVQKLKERSAQLLSLVGDGSTGQKEYHQMLYLAKFQLIDMGMMLFDVGAASSVVHLVTAVKAGFTESFSCSFFYLYYSYRPMTVADIVLRALGDCVLAYAHGGLFIAYVIFLKKFRKAFVDVCRKLAGKEESQEEASRTGSTVVTAVARTTKKAW